MHFPLSRGSRLSPRLLLRVVPSGSQAPSVVFFPRLQPGWESAPCPSSPHRPWPGTAARKTPGMPMVLLPSLQLNGEPGPSPSQGIPSLWISAESSPLGSQPCPGWQDSQSPGGHWQHLVLNYSLSGASLLHPAPSELDSCSPKVEGGGRLRGICQTGRKSGAGAAQEPQVLGGWRGSTRTL